MPDTSGSDIPLPREGVDYASVSLDAREGFVLSRVDGRSDVDTLSDVTGFGPAEVIEVLTKLSSLELIDWSKGGVLTVQESTPAPQASVAKKIDTKQAERDKLLAESGDLSRAERLHILVLERDLLVRNHWDILALSGVPTRSDVKKAYFSRSKKFHPDSYFGRDTGSFRPKIAAVFAGIKEAYDVLGNDKSRREYEAKNPAPSAEKKKMPTSRRRSSGNTSAVQGETKSAAEDAEKKARLEKRRAEILAQRKAKTEEPGRSKAQLAKEFFEKGQACLKEKNTAAAADAFRLASTYAPSNDDYRRRHEELSEVVNHDRVAKLVEIAGSHKASGDLASAAQVYASAAEILPQMASHSLNAGECYFECGRYDTALKFAKLAIKASPRRKEARVLAAQIYLKTSKKDAAIAELEIALSLDKTDGRVNKLLKKLLK